MVDFKILLKDIFTEDSEEFAIIKDSYDCIISSAPTISAEAKTQMILLDHNRTKLSTLYFMLARKISTLKSTYQSDWDTQYARLVKIGRPSKDSIESEIRANNPALAGAIVQVNQYEQVQELVSMYMRCIDSAKQTATELLRDSRRLD